MFLHCFLKYYEKDHVPVWSCLAIFRLCASFHRSRNMELQSLDSFVKRFRVYFESSTRICNYVCTQQLAELGLPVSVLYPLLKPGKRTIRSFYLSSRFMNIAPSFPTSPTADTSLGCIYHLDSSNFRHVTRTYRIRFLSIYMANIQFNKRASYILPLLVRQVRLGIPFI